MSLVQKNQKRRKIELDCGLEIKPGGGGGGGVRGSDRASLRYSAKQSLTGARLRVRCGAGLFMWPSVLTHITLKRVLVALAPPHSSGAVWESRWPSWAVRPNEPSGFRGRKELLNRASALVTTCHLRTLSMLFSLYWRLLSFSAKCFVCSVVVFSNTDTLSCGWLVYK